MSFRLGDMARVSVVCLAAIIPAGGALAQAPQGSTPQTSVPQASAPQPSAPQASAVPTGDPVVATVNGRPIHLSELRSAAATLPPNLRTMPEPVLYPMLLDRLIDQQALADEARRIGLDKDPAVQQQVHMAEDAALQRALLLKDVQPLITDQAVHARYEKDIAGKSGAEEVHAKHILVDSETQAKDIIAQLDAGADFDTLAKKYSKDPGATQGGDLGFFKKEDMVPEFAAAAFALQPGQVTQTPVHTQFGWHVIKVIERRQAKPPSFEEAKDELRQRMAQEAAEKVVADARSHVTVEKFNLDGSPVRATDATTMPPPAK